MCSFLPATAHCQIPDFKQTKMITKLKQYYPLAWKLLFSFLLLPISSKKTFTIILKRIRKRTEAQWFGRNASKLRDYFSSTNPTNDRSNTPEWRTPYS